MPKKTEPKKKPETKEEPPILKRTRSKKTPRALSVDSERTAKRQIPDIKTTGDPYRWVTICKASSEAQGWKRSTKALQLDGTREAPGGCLLQVSTLQTNPDGSFSLAEAVTYVPNCVIRIKKVRGREENSLSIVGANLR